MNRILIEFVAQEQQRYDTLGDWLEDEDGLVIRSTCDGDEDESFLIALHELVEAWICRKAQITQQDVDAFDFYFAGDGEPGDHPDAPYREQHRKAMLIEHLMANFMGVSDYGEVR